MNQELETKLKPSTAAKAAIENLAPNDQAALLEQFLQTREREKQVLADALEQSLRFVPRLARGAVKKILFPS